MAEFFDHLSEKLASFVEEQPMFFVATAASDARINLSPKGMDTFRVLDSKTCAYLDLTGSGNETAAHIKHDGRITIMFNSFTRNPMILRVYGKGRVAALGTPEFEAHIERFPKLAGTRQIIFIDIDSVQTSCGYAVPEMTLVGERDTLIRYSENKGEAFLAEYRREKNTESIDGLATGLSD